MGTPYLTILGLFFRARTSINISNLYDRLTGNTPDKFYHPEQKLLNGQQSKQGDHSKTTIVLWMWFSLIFKLVFYIYCTL